MYVHSHMKKNRAVHSNRQSISIPIVRPSEGTKALLVAGTRIFSLIFSGVASTDSASIGCTSLTLVEISFAFLRRASTFARLTAMLTKGKLGLRFLYNYDILTHRFLQKACSLRCLISPTRFIAFIVVWISSRL